MSLVCLRLFFLHVTRRFSRTELATLAGIAAFFVFNPNQLQNFNWFFQVAFLSAFLFAVLALAAISLYAHYKETYPAKRRLPKVADRRNILRSSGGIQSRKRYFDVDRAAGFAALYGRTPAHRDSPLRSCLARDRSLSHRLPHAGRFVRSVCSLRHLDRVFAYSRDYFAESWHFIAPDPDRQLPSLLSC